MNAAIYARYSSENQRDASIEDQIRVCREYCKARDLVIVETYHDNALSGLSDDRPDFQRMIRDGERRAFDVLVLYALDRFSRNKYDAAIYKARLKKAGVSVCYVTTPIGEGPEAVLMESLLEGLSQYYSENLARSVKRGLIGNALRGVWANGCVPFGLTLTPDRHLIPDPHTAPAVRDIFDWFLAGVSRVEIARRLNASGYKTARGKAFSGTSLAPILKNKIYIGIYTYCDIVNENAVEPIIDKSLFSAVQKKLETLYKARGHNKAVDPYLLTTKLYCGACGRWLVGDGANVNGRRYNYYVCPGVIRGNHDCNTRRIRKEYIERLIANICRETLTDARIIDIADTAAARFAADADTTKDIARYEKQLADIERKINNILTAIENGVISNNVNARLKSLEDERATVRISLECARIAPPALSAAEIAFYLKSLREGDTEDPAYQQLLINNLLNSATLYHLPDNSRKLALAFNLTPDANREIVLGAEFMDIGRLTHLNYQYPKFVIIKRCLCTVIDIKK